MFDNIDQQRLADAFKRMLAHDGRVSSDERRAARERISEFERAAYHPAVMAAAWSAAAPGQIMVNVEGSALELRYFAPDGGSSAGALDRVLAAYAALYREQVAPAPDYRAELDEIYGTEEAAEYAKMSVQAIKWNFREGRLIGKLVGRSLVFTKRTLDAFLALPPATTGRPRGTGKDVDDSGE